MPKEKLPKNAVGVGGLPWPMVDRSRGTAEFAFSGKFAYVKAHQTYAGRRVDNTDGTQSIVEMVEPSGRLPDRIYGRGESGAFLLHQAADASSPTIVRLDNVDEVDKTISECPWVSPFHQMGFDLVDWVRSPTFQIKKCSEATENGLPLIKMEFALKGASPAMHADWRDAIVTVSPTESWVIRRFQVSSKHLPKHYDIVIDYSPPIDSSGIPLAKRRELRDMVSESISEISDVVHEDLPASRFTMAAFGLPDINKPIAEHVPGESARWYYRAAAAAGLFAIGLRVAYVLRERRARAAAPRSA
jgi:hypothetical protein